MLQLWCSDGATSTFALRAKMRECEVAKAKLRRCEGEGAKVRRCEGESAKAKERYYYHKVHLTPYQIYFKIENSPIFYILCLYIVIVFQTISGTKCTKSN